MIVISMKTSASTESTLSCIQLAKLKLIAALIFMNLPRINTLCVCVCDIISFNPKCWRAKTTVEHYIIPKAHKNII